MYTIYALIDARDRMFRYVGFTDDVYRRFKEHVAGNSKNLHKNAWIEELKEEQIMLVMETLATTGDYQEALELESNAIQRLLLEGHPLFNIATVRYSPPRKHVQCKVYRAGSGAGRKNTDDEVNQILDAYILHGILPHDVSERTRRMYKKHPRLEERRKLLGKPASQAM